MVDIPEMQFLAIDGQGGPNTSPYYAQAVESLFSVAYALKFQTKTQLGRDMTVGPLEGLWRGSQEDYVRRNRGNWLWTMIIFQPGWITTEMLTVAQGKVRSKKPLSAIEDLRLTVLHEGLSVQTLHLGAYDNEGPVLARLHNEYMPRRGLTPPRRSPRDLPEYTWPDITGEAQDNPPSAGTNRPGCSPKLTCRPL